MGTTSTKEEAAAANEGLTMTVSKYDIDDAFERSVRYASTVTWSHDIREAPVQVQYTCEGKGKCTYESALQEILHGTATHELRNRGVQTYVEEVVKSIKRNPGVFPGMSSNGLLFNANGGKPCLYLRNAGEGDATTGGKIGVLDLDHFRNEIRDVARITDKDRDEVVATSGTSLGFGFALGYLFRAARRIR